MKRLILSVVDVVFGNTLVKSALRSLAGFRYFRWFIHLSRYRACHMVSAGEVCLLAGIFYERTVRDFARIIGPNGKAIVVEANPENIRRLSTAIDAPNVKYVNCAVWDKRGEMEFITSVGDEQGYNRLDDPQMQEFPYHMDREPTKIKVATNTLDNIAAECGVEVVHHLNLTINGAELQALDGIDRLLQNNPQLRIYINSEFPAPAQDVIEKLKSLGFAVYTSSLISTLNKQIRLIRIYAVHQG